MGHSKKGIIVNTIIALVMAAIFVLVAASVLGTFFSGFCRPSGAIADATNVVCFGGGKDQYIRCLNKADGIEAFSVGAAPNWDKKEAKSTPVLTKDAIYSGLGQYFISYAITGTQKFCGIRSDHTIPTGVAVDKTDGTEELACFGGGSDHTLHCQNTGTGEQVFSVKFKAGESNFDGDKNCPLWMQNIQEIPAGTRDTETTSEYYHEAGSNNYYYSNRECRALATPAIVDNQVYFALGNKVCRISADSISDATASATCKAFDWTIGDAKKPMGITVDKDKELVCFGGGKDHNMRCLDLNLNDKLKVHAGDKWLLRDAKSTPTITADKIYFGIGNRVCAVSADERASVDAQLIVEGKVAGAWCSKSFGYIISTGIAVDETNKLVCFGGGADQTVHCLNTDTGNEAFYIRAGNWDEKDADSTPLISDNVIYAAIGDKVCAFKLPIMGGDKDFSDGVFEYSGDVDAKWGICYDVDYQIPTGIVGLQE